MDFLTELSKKYSDNLPIRAIVSVMGVGSFIDLCCTQKWQKYRENRINDFITKVEKQLATIDMDCIKHEYLESEEFFDIVYSILKDIVGNRLPEKRTVYAKIIKDAMEQNESTDSIESLIEQVGQLKEKDLKFFSYIKQFVESKKLSTFSGQTLTKFIDNSQDYNIEEVTRLLFRFSYLGLLDYKTNILTLRTLIEFNATNLFYKLSNYLNEIE